MHNEPSQPEVDAACCLHVLWTLPCIQINGTNEVLSYLSLPEVVCAQVAISKRAGCVALLMVQRMGTQPRRATVVTIDDTSRHTYPAS
jgi:hypothetical protein